MKTGYTYFRENVVLFTKIMPCMENGKGAIARFLKNGIGFGPTEFHVLSPKTDITAEFLYFLLLQKSIRSQAEANMTGGAGQKRVPTDFFTKLMISQPFIDLQNEFVHRIESIKRQKALLQKEIQKSEELFDGMLQKSFKFE